MSTKVLFEPSVLETTYPKIHSPWKRWRGDDPNRPPTVPVGNFRYAEWSTPAIQAVEGIEWVAEEKIDGMNMRLEFSTPDLCSAFGGELRVNGRSNRAEIPQNLRNRIIEVFSPINFHDALPNPTLGTVVLYGEGCGAGIQSGADYTKGHESLTEFVLFDVWYPAEDWWLAPAEVTEFADNLGIHRAPIVDNVFLLDSIESYVRGGFKTSLFGRHDKPAEGIVLKPPVILKDSRNRRIVTKLKTKDFVTEPE